MKNRLIPSIALVVYAAILVKVMVFKSVPPIRVGPLMLNFGGTQGGKGNFVPFKTIVPYILGEKGLIIGGLNLVGNVALLVPIGILVPLIWRNVSWKTSLAIAIASGLIIEFTQVLLRVGIFDIDDVILNALGVMIGYWIFIIFSKWTREKKTKNVVIAIALIFGATAACGMLVHRDVKSSMSFRPNTTGVQTDTGGSVGDLCGGTGGNGQILSVSPEERLFVLGRKDGNNQIIHLTDDAKINAFGGVTPISDLNVGDRVTLVGDPGADGSFTAYAIFVCAVPDAEKDRGR